jgi:hypothetical protein
MVWSVPTNPKPPLIPRGWRVDWDVLFHENPDPSDPTIADWFLAGRDVFFARHVESKRGIDVEFWTELGPPPIGIYRLQVLRFLEPQPLSENGSVQPALDWDSPIFVFDTISVDMK